MLMTDQERLRAKDSTGRCFVSVGPSGLVVSTGNETRLEADENWTGVITVRDRLSGLATHLDHDEAIHLAASLILASRYLTEEEKRDEGRGQPKLRCRS